MTAPPQGPPRIWTKGERVRLTLVGRAETVDGVVLLASPNGVSLAVEFPGEFFAGYLERVPLLWDNGHFRDLASNRPVTVVPAEQRKRGAS